MVHRNIDDLNAKLNMFYKLSAAVLAGNAIDDEFNLYPRCYRRFSGRVLTPPPSSVALIKNCLRV